MPGRIGVSKDVIDRARALGVNKMAFKSRFHARDADGREYEFPTTLRSRIKSLTVQGHSVTRVVAIAFDRAGN